MGSRDGKGGYVCVCVCVLGGGGERERERARHACSDYLFTAPGLFCVFETLVCKFCCTSERGTPTSRVCLSV
jgi:hypothetical protein